MELSVLDGAAKKIARCRPVMFIEYFKSDKAALAQRIISMDYDISEIGLNFLCIPKENVGDLLQKDEAIPSGQT
ncbi:MAG TPA: hypothetical protein VHX86_16555 [Tepidisphaeraceae bacterium]|jgi:hypothetical protein|nr:hypothetical protein [Tepidisphaeraceae bacterium]